MDVSEYLHTFVQTGCYCYCAIPILYDARFEKYSLAEFRRAMSPDFSCPWCRESFGSALELDQQLKDDEVNDYHAVLKEIEEQSAKQTN